ncbi:Sterigmatocystin biosynthesis protein [Madurella fahalii]|uniref:Sterigmatocystin biosynthesis protein n=1 Tax=Madurella fahalii TaxID=1157608 RepID=A0ABQ0GN50_9PEZI
MDTAVRSLSISALLLRALGFLFLVALARFFYRMHQVRTLVRRFHKQNDVEMIPHSYLLGHLVVIGKIMAKYPRDMFPISVATLVLQQYPHLEKYGFILMDSWPFVQPMIYVFDPEISAQFTQIQSLPKSTDLKAEFRPLTQNKDLVTLDGSEWKLWRSIYNPGFSAKNLMSMIPAFLEEIRVFVDRLRAAAKSGEILRIEEPATNLTIDIIGRAVLRGTRLHCQTQDNPLQRALAKQISWLCPEYTPPSLLKLINPARPLLMWNYNRIIRNYLVPIIQRNVAAQAEGTITATTATTTTTTTKTVVSLAAKAYLAEKGSPAGQTPHLDAEFISMTVPQLIIFLFAGHDTTASTLCFAYHLLSQNPGALARLRAEHDAVLGTDLGAVEAKLAANPQLLNGLAYTGAVAKETLRLFPPAATVRAGQAGFELVHPRTGRRYPTEGVVVHQNSFATHRLPALFPRPLDFLPERFLAAEGEPLHVPRNAFRPFELGPRACIGQELALMEVKTILAMTAREFDVDSCFPRPGAGTEGVDEVLGQSVYAVGNITGHPVGGMPCRVRTRVHGVGK